MHQRTIELNLMKALIQLLKPSEEPSKEFLIMISWEQEITHKREDHMCGKHGLKLMKLQKT